MAQPDNSGNFFQRLISAILGSFDPEAEKKRILRSIAKEVNKSKFKFYKHSSGDAQVGLAKFFYEIYKNIGAAQVMFESTQNPNTFKHAVIDFVMSEKQRELIEFLNEQAILALAQTMPPNELKKKIQTDLETLSQEFDIQKIQKIDALYTKLMLFQSFCTFDFYFLLKKFDSSLMERDFNYMPRFEPIRGEYITDDLKDFIAVAWAMPLNEDWSEMLALLRNLKGIEPIAANTWNKTIQRLRQVQNSQILEKIIKLTTSDPNYQAFIPSRQERLFEPYLDTLKKEVQETLVKIEKEVTNSRADNLLKNIFGTTAVIRLKYYSETANLNLEKKRVPLFKYHQPLNYTKAFLLDYFKKNIREFSDLVLVRGKWVTAVLSGQMSEVYQNIAEISDQITEFDEALSDEAAVGQKLKNLLLRVGRDREAERIIASLIKDTNDKALFYITSTAQNLIALAKTIKSLLEDREKPEPQMLINWKELDKFVDHPIRDTGVEIYKMIHQFIQLIQIYIPKK
ncbi:MAG TPA: DUF5312 family protein [Treponemataceae bacterium]|nr:DUF5312 family protein [Treponemataceae bacterium]